MDKTSTELTLKLIVGFYKAHKLDNTPTSLIISKSLSTAESGTLERREERYQYKNTSQYEASLLAISESLQSLPKLVDGIGTVMTTIKKINIEVVSTERVMFKAMARITDLLEFMSDEYDLTPQEQLDVYWKVEARVPSTYKAMNKIALIMHQVRYATHLTLTTSSSVNDKRKLKELSKVCKDHTKQTAINDKSVGSDSEGNVVAIRKI